MTSASRPVRGLHHFAYRCRDCGQTRRFYEDLLGMPLVHAAIAAAGDETCASVQMHFALADGTCIAFFDLDDGSAAGRAPDARGWDGHLALRMDSLDALCAVKERLVAAGVDVSGPVEHRARESIFCVDPNGVRLELTTPGALAAEIGELAAQASRELERWTAHRNRPSYGDVSMGSPSPELSALWLARAFNAKDVEAAAALYDPEASIVQIDDVHGATRIARGAEAIRATMAAYIDLDPHMDVVTHHTTVAGDLAMTRSQWRITGTDREGKPIEVHHHGMEVHRRGADGSWYFCIDHPFGADPHWAIPRPPPTER